MKPEPVIVSVTAAEPAFTFAGEMELIVGTVVFVVVPVLPPLLPPLHPARKLARAIDKAIKKTRDAAAGYRSKADNSTEINLELI